MFFLIVGTNCKLYTGVPHLLLVMMTVEEEVCGDVVQMSYFDIKYLLGGSEKKVQETYISCTPLEIAARQSAPRNMFTVEVPEVSKGMGASIPPPLVR